MATPAAILNILVQAQGVTQASGALSRLDANAQRAFGNVSQAAQRSAGDVGAAGDKAGKDYASGLSAGLNRAKTAMKATGAGLAAAVGAGVVTGLDVEEANKKFQAQLGGNGKFSKDMGKVAGSLYANAYGDSLGEVQQAVRGVINDGAVMEDASNKQIGRITSKALDLAKVFDQDVGGVTRAVGQMMRTGLAKDADQALDILTRGFQQGGDKAEDLLDTVNEYSTLFRTVGLDGETAMALISQGLRAGARDADKVADAIKEFSVRAVDGSDSTIKGFRALGLSAGQMAEQIARGGPAAREGLDTVLDRLRAIEDPVKRSRVAVQLFGTQAEDLGAALYALDPSSAVMGLGNVEGAAKRMGDTFNDTLKVRLEAFKRQGLQALAELANTYVFPALIRLADGFGTLAKAVGAIVGWFERHETITLALAAAIGTAVTAFAAYKIAVIANTVATAAWAAATAAVGFAAAAARAPMLALALVFAANPIGIIVVALAAFAAAIVVAYRESETFRKIVNAAWEAVKKVAGPVVEWFAEAIPKAWDVVKKATTAVWNFLQPYLEGVWSALKVAITAYFGAYKAVVTAAWDAIRAATTALWNWFGPYLKGIWEALKSVLSTYFDGYKSMIGTTWDVIKTITRAAWNAFEALVVTPVRDAASIVRNLLGQDGLRGWLGNLWEGIKGSASAAWLRVKEFIVDPIRDAASAIRNLLGEDGLRGWLGNVWDGIKGGFDNAKDGLLDAITAPFKGAVKLVAGFAKKILQIVDEIPGVSMKGPIGAIDKFTEGLKEGGVYKAYARGGAFARTGGMVNGPITLMGEEAPRHPEYVIPTNPAYRKRAQTLALQAAGAVGLAEGGVISAFKGAIKDTSAGPKASLALFEAGVVESGLRNLPYGDRDSRGALQIRDSTARGMGINNMDPVASALAFLTRGFWGKGGAISLARNYMASAGWVAQQVQGSAFPERYDQARETALKYLNGAGSTDHGIFGDVAGFISGLVKSLPGVGSLPDWLQGTGKHLIGEVTKWIGSKVKGLFGAVIGRSVPGWGQLDRLASDIGLQITSTMRPGDSGYHGRAMGLGGRARATDYSNSTGPTPEMLRFAQEVAGRFGSQLKELIYKPLGWGIKDGERVGLNFPYPWDQHLNHVHVAFRKGGMYGGLLGSYKDGTPYVPQTGAYLLHKGESVIPQMFAKGGKYAKGIPGSATKPKKMTSLERVLYERAAAEFARRMADRFKKGISADTVQAAAEPLAVGSVTSDPNQALIDSNTELQAAIDAQTRADEAHTEALNAVQAEIKRQTDFAASVQSTSNYQLTKTLADILSGHIVGRGVAGRAFTPGNGTELAY